MNLGIQLNTGLKLEQKLSPQMIQSLKLLQVTALDLETMIKQELEVNPLLEIEEEIDLRESVKDEEDRPKEKEEALEELTSVNEKEEVDWEEVYSDGFDLGYKSHGEYDDTNEEMMERSPTYQTQLQDQLVLQLHDRFLEDDIIKVCEYLIYSLDDDGFLRKTLEEAPSASTIADFEEGITSEMIVEIDEVINFEKEYLDATPLIRDAFHTLWTLEPKGVGARDLRECLLLQAQSETQTNPLVIPILEDGFDLLSKMQISNLAKKFEKSSAEIQAALGEIGKLDPKPGRGKFGGMAPTVTPDVFVEKIHGEFVVLLNDRNVPALRVSQSYSNIIKKDSTSSKDEKKFVKDKLAAANWWVKSIEQRKSTIRKVMTAILELQHAFFEDGAEYLKPLVLQDVADMIEMHVSTVNRVTNGKYVQTPNGLFELKYFFSSSVEQADGSEISATQTKEAIKRLIEGEPTSKPLSDQALTNALAKEGLKVARRTVAKYREQLQILPARLRKKF
jgi:RNA polymerase sigma-54 factor